MARTNLTKVYDKIISEIQKFIDTGSCKLTKCTFTAHANLDCIFLGDRHFEYGGKEYVGVFDGGVADWFIPINREESTNVGNAMYRLRDAIEAYRKLLATLNSDRQLSGKDEYGFDDRDAIKSFSESVKAISHYLDEAIDDMKRGGY